ncbi:MAG: hypothetical protein KGQ36_02585 [Rickettsiales bacterium]|nr:hypothetical protein [Rickettsiales bacterium]
MDTAKFHNSEKFLERFPHNKKSIIILKFSAKSPKDYLLWCPVFDLDDHIVDDDNCRKTYATDSYKIFMFEPGFYKLSEYEFDENQYIFQKPKKKFSTKSSLSFKADAGEIIYAGFIKENGVKKHEVIDEFVILKNALATKNYQELDKLFAHDLKDLEWLVTNYHNSPKYFVKELFEGKKLEVKTEINDEAINPSSCTVFCDREVLRKREKEIEVDREKYSKKYLQQLIDELNSDKEKCGIKTKVKNAK